jgi:hypothetical protein
MRPDTARIANRVLALAGAVAVVGGLYAYLTAVQGYQACQAVRNDVSGAYTFAGIPLARCSHASAHSGLVVVVAIVLAIILRVVRDTTPTI